jgi:amino acid adenylation domain-containing protein
LWQRQWLQGQRLEQQLLYWRRQLAPPLPVLELPPDVAAPGGSASSHSNSDSCSSSDPCSASSSQSRPAAAAYHLLPAPLARNLLALSRQQGATLFMTLLASFQLLLHRYSGQTDIVVGTPVAGRTRTEVQNLIGFFVNTLPIRSQLLPHLSFLHLLQQLRLSLLEAWAHQDIPLERIIEDLQPERDLDRQPLFQVLMSMQDAPASSLQLPGLDIELLPSTSPGAKFDLSLFMEENPDGIHINVEYLATRFSPVTLQRLLTHWQRLLEGLAADPECCLADLPLLSSEERSHLLLQGNADPFPLSPHTVMELFEQQVALRPQALAVRDTSGNCLTYAQLNAAANRWARRLHHAGIGPEARVGVCLQRSCSLIVALLAVLKSGAAYVPLDPSYPQDRLAFMAQDADLSLLLTQASLTSALPDTLSSLPILKVEDDEDTKDGANLEDTSNLPLLAQPDNLAYVIYTSGSTGRPKGVMVSHRSLANLLSSFKDKLAFQQTDVWFAITSLSFDIAALELFLPMVCGGITIVAAKEFVQDVKKLSNALTETNATVLQAVPTVWRSLLNSGMPKGLRLGLCGGEALSTHLAHALAEVAKSAWNVYGPTETTIWSTLHRVTYEDEVRIGRPIGNTQVYVLDQNGNLVPAGVPGELYIGGAGVARGYLRQPSLTAQRFLPDPFSSLPGQRLYCSGDLVRWRHDGSLEFLGRNDAQVKIRGFRIELGEIEAVLLQPPFVAQAAVTALPAPSGELRLVGFLVWRQPQPPDAMQQVQQHLRHSLPDYMVPALLLELAALPLTPNGKLDRKALAALQPTSEQQNDLVAPRSPVEEVLVNIWAQVLQRERISIHDNFFQLGGHSLLATELLSRMNQTFSLNLPLRAIFENPNLAQMAQLAIDGKKQERSIELPAIQRVERATPLPLSYSQERIWLINQFDSAKTPYNICVAARIEGSLDALQLKQSILHIIRRHESLRTNFIMEKGQPRQVIHNDIRVTLPTIELGGVPEEERKSVSKKLAQEEASRHFDLTRDPLFQFKLLRLTAENHILILNMHHVISDAWSLGTLLQELSAIYESFSSGKLPQLEELPVQYADFSIWQRNWLSGAVLEQKLEYWQKQLADLEILELPTDRPRPPVQNHNGACINFTESAELTAKLKSVGQQRAATFYMVLLAAFQTLLHRYTGQRDFAIGSPVAGRIRREIEQLVGCFINILVLRADLSGDPTFVQLLERTRNTSLDAFTHQDAPFEAIISRLQPDRDVSRTPLFQVMFVLQNAPQPEMRLGPASLRLFDFDTQTTQYDLTLVIRETESGLEAGLQYNTDLFESSTITHMIEHFQILLSGIVADPEVRISELPLLTDSEQEEMLLRWNETEYPCPQYRCIHELIEEQAEQAPQKIAAEFQGLRLSYADLNRQANQIAQYLMRVGVGPEVRVAICMERCLEMIVGLLGILKAGGAYVPLDPSYPADRLAFMLRDAQVPVLLTEERVLKRLPEYAGHILCVNNVNLSRESRENPKKHATSSNLAYVIYTSGSTGQARGVGVSHENLCASTFARGLFYKEPVGRYLLLSSLSFDSSVAGIFWSLIQGGTLMIPSEDEYRDPTSLRTLIEERGVTHLLALPSVYDLLLRNGTSLNGLKVAIVAGEKCPGSLVMLHRQRAPQTLLVNEYGPTEATVWATAWQDDNSPASRIPIGRPIANTRVYVLDEQMKPVPRGTTGELYIEGMTLSRGYLNRQGLTAEKFVPNPFGKKPGERLYRTGDRTRWTANGMLEYLGRADHQVKLRGFRIELGEIESALREQLAVKEVAVTVWEDGYGGKHLVGYLGAEKESLPIPQEIQRSLRNKLPDYMVPSTFVLLDVFPRTPTGKLNLKALPKPVPDNRREYVAPRNEIEQIIADIWRKILNADRVGIYDNFFDLGGHSLLAMQAVTDIGAEFYIDIPLRELFKKPILHEFSSAVLSLQIEQAGLTEFANLESTAN